MVYVFLANGFEEMEALALWICSDEQALKFLL